MCIRDRFIKSLPSLQVFDEGEWINSRVRGPTSTKHLPASDAKWPLKNGNQCEIEIGLARVSSAHAWITNHICLFSENTIQKTFQGHPFDREFDDTFFFHIPIQNMSEIVFGVDVFWETKVSHFDDKIVIDPGYKINYITNGYTLYTCMHIHMHVYSHAISCCQVSVHKFLFSKILHSFDNLETHCKKLFLSFNNLYAWT